MHRQLHRRIIAPAGEQQVIAQATQAVRKVRCTAALEVGIHQVRQRHADRRARHEVGVERFDGGDAEQEAARRGGPGVQPFQAIGKRAGAMEPANHHCGVREQFIEQQIDRRVFFNPPDVGQVQRREVGRQLRAGLLQRQQIGVGLREHDQGSRVGEQGSGIGLWPSAPGPCPLTPVPRKPVEEVRSELSRWRKMPFGGEERLDIIVEGDNQRAIVERMEPVGPTIEQEHGDIRQRARPQAAALVEVHRVTQLAPLPFLVVEVGWHREEAPVGVAAAAAGGADEQHPAAHAGIDHAPVDALHHIAFEAFVAQNSIPFCALMP
jgi:hypothetical protein